MIDDLFYREQEILEEANNHLKSTEGSLFCDRENYAKLVKEYARILRLYKRVTRVSDKTTVELNSDKLRLLNMVQYDGLTGIYNRLYFKDEWQKIVMSCAEEHTCLGVLMMDVDNFKLYNDTYGHGAGDDCLRSIARTLEETFENENGFAARYGGEEFVAVLPGATGNEVCRIAESILKNIKLLNIPHEKNAGRDCVTISIGGTCIHNVKEAEKNSYLQTADEALYRSKQTGRDRFTLLTSKEESK